MDLIWQGDTWALGLACVVVVIMLLRTRLLPLIPQRVVLLTAAVLPLLTGVAPLLTSLQRSLAAASVGAVLLGMSIARPSDVLAARLRRAAEIAELMLVVAAVPLALGALGVYADLLETFR